MNDLKIVIVGHVDHGKSTLIGRLFFDTDSLPLEKKREIESIAKDRGQDIEFAFVMDHLEEERDQGITIDTTQTFFKTEKRNYIIIDAPGHKEFLKNMITGASQAEAAILIVDAEEGVREQTKRHSYILSFLGITQVSVVVNKMDLIEYDQEKFESIKKELIEFLAKINIKPDFIIPISAKKGDNVSNHSENMQWYKGKNVLESLDEFKEFLESTNKTFCMPVQDVYKIEDKRITVGRIESGKINTGDEIIVFPTKEKTKVKSIEVYKKEKTDAKVGECIGITTTDPLFIERGNIITKEIPDSGNLITADLFWMSKEPINVGENIIIRGTTQETECTITKIIRKLNSSSLELIDNADHLENTETAEVELTLNKPIVLKKFTDVATLGRFVLVRKDTTVAGGIVRKINSDSK